MPKIEIRINSSPDEANADDRADGETTPHVIRHVGNRPRCTTTSKTNSDRNGIYHGYEARGSVERKHNQNIRGR